MGDSVAYTCGVGPSRVGATVRLSAGLFAAAILVSMPVQSHSRENDLIAKLEQLADAGNAEAVYYLGMAYQTGSGVPEDHGKALEAFRKSAGMGDPLASYKLGCYFEGQYALIAPDERKALELKLVAAEAGYALAQQDVAALFARRGDPSRGLQWLQKSADQGWPDGFRAMASIYNGAAGIEPDAAKTAGYFRLYLDRVGGGSETQRNWLANFEAGMSADEKARARQLVQNFRSRPTVLTIKALAGQDAARWLVADRH